MSVNGNITCANRLYTKSLTITTGTRAVMLVDQALGGLLLPDSTAFPSSQTQVTRGGQRVIGGGITSTDGTARDVLLYRGKVLTTQSTPATGALAVATTSTITRAAGDFRADNWGIGDAVMVFGTPPSATTFGVAGMPDYSSTPAVLASVGILAIVTGVAALTLTVSGTPLLAESLVGCRLIRVAQAFRQTVALQAGNAAATSAALLIGGSNDLDINNLLAADRGISLGAEDVLLVAAQAAISALPAQLNFSALSVLF